MAIISKESIEEIKQVAKLSDVVQEYTSLKRSGKQYVGLCPFHAERTPSFYIDPTNTFYYCFGCGAKGNIFSFLSEKKGFNFIQSIEFLAGKYGIKLTYSKFDSKNSALYEINEYTHRAFVEFLKKSNIAKDYLLARSIEQEDWSKFELGFCPSEGATLARELVSKFGIELTKKGGFIRYEEGSGRIIDFFAGRVIFPIKDSNGRVLGFGGRTIDDNLKPKYLNSPDTEIFKKSKVVYGLNFVKKSTDIYILEGYFDVLALLKANIPAVCPGGTNFTLDQLKILENIAKNLIFIYDADLAGFKSGIKTAILTASSCANISFVLLPPGMDPDDYLRSFSVDQFLSLKKLSPEEYILEAFLALKGKSEFSDLDKQEIVELTEYINEYLTNLGNPLLQNRAKAYFSSKLRIREFNLNPKDKPLVDLPDDTLLSLINKYPSLKNEILKDPFLAGEIPADLIYTFLEEKTSILSPSKIDFYGKLVSEQEIIEFLRKTLITRKISQIQKNSNLNEFVESKKKASKIFLKSDQI